MNLDAHLAAHGFTHEMMEGFIRPEQKEQLRGVLKDLPVRRMIEIGLNAGHSCDFFFETLKGLELFVSFDINQWAYTPVAVNYLSQKYGHRFRFIEGDSVRTLPQFAATCTEKFDLIFVDGGHDYRSCENDIVNGRALAHPETLLIIDDYHHPAVGMAVLSCLGDRIVQGIQDYARQDGPKRRRWLAARYLFS